MVNKKNILITSLFAVVSLFETTTAKRLCLAYVLPSCEKAYWSADGSKIETESRSNAFLELFDAKTGALLRSFKASRWGAGFSPNGRYLSMPLKDRFQIIDVSTGLCEKEICGLYDSNPNLSAWYYGIWSPDSRYLIIPELTQSSNCVPRRVLYDVQTKELCELDSSLDLFCRGNLFISWHPNSHNFATHNAQEVFIWNVHEKAPIRRFQHEKVSIYYWMADDNLFVTESYDEAKVWDLDTGELLRTLNLSCDDSHGACAGFHHTKDLLDNGWLFVGSNCGVLRLYDVYTGCSKILGSHDEMWTMRCSTNGKYLVTFGNGKKVWNIKKGRSILNLRRTFSECVGEGCALSNDYLAIGSREGSLELWDIHSKKLIQEIQDSTGEIKWSPDGTRLMTQSYSEGIKVWDLV